MQSVVVADCNGSLVRASTFCELCVLSRDDFSEVVTQFTDEKHLMEELILQKYKGELVTSGEETGLFWSYFVNG